MFRRVFGTMKGERPLKPYEQLRKHWDDTRAGIETTSHDESEVAALEARYGIRLPGDFREYLLMGSPLEEWDAWDNEMVTWWGLPRILNVPEEYDHWQTIKNPDVLSNATKYLFFADYCIWCWAWAIECGEGPNRGRVVIIGGDDPFVADSFAEFVTRYSLDPVGVSVGV